MRRAKLPADTESQGSPSAISSKEETFLFSPFFPTDVATVRLLQFGRRCKDETFFFHTNQVRTAKFDRLKTLNPISSLLLN